MKKQFSIMEFISSPSISGLILKHIKSFDFKIDAEIHLAILSHDKYYRLTIIETYIS